MKTMERQRGRELGWEPGLRRAAWAASGSYGAVALVIRDLEALVVAVGILVGIGLLGFRKGMLGILLLGALFANGAAWMIPAASSNIRHGEGLFETLLPAAIAAVSLVGLASAAGRLFERRRRTEDGRGPALVVAIGGVGLAATAVLGVVGVGTAQTPRAGDVVLTAERTRFSETSISVPAGEVAVQMANRDLFWHTFTVPGLGVDLNVPVRGERRVTFEAEPGTYEFICAIPGHVQAGMKGTLTVP